MLELIATKDSCYLEDILMNFDFGSYISLIYTDIISNDSVKTEFILTSSYYLSTLNNILKYIATSNSIEIGIENAKAKIMTEEQYVDMRTFLKTHSMSVDDNKTIQLSLEIYVN